jgi:hypothetical protein
MLPFVYDDFVACGRISKTTQPGGSLVRSSLEERGRRTAELGNFRKETS